MRKVPSEKLEAHRIREGTMRSKTSDGMQGAFALYGPSNSYLRIISSGPDETYGWEHVSVSLTHRTPNWQEMCFVKDLFWEESELVVQFHPPKSEYINCHPNCLHMWRPLDGHIKLPPSITVGPKENDTVQV